jgi:hypothetical protein
VYNLSDLPFFQLLIRDITRRFQRFSCPTLRWRNGAAGHTAPLKWTHVQRRRNTAGADSYLFPDVMRMPLEQPEASGDLESAAKHAKIQRIPCYFRLADQIVAHFVHTTCANRVYNLASRMAQAISKRSLPRGEGCRRLNVSLPAKYAAELQSRCNKTRISMADQIRRALDREWGWNGFAQR